MNRNFYVDRDGKTPCCIYCEKLIPDGRWFARFPFGVGWVSVCRPYCLEKFLDTKSECARKLGIAPAFLPLSRGKKIA